jgi:hypothetical protein
MLNGNDKGEQDVIVNWQVVGELLEMGRIYE